MPRVSRLLVAVAAVALLSGCTSAPTSPHQSGAPAGFEGIYGQQAFWNSCTDNPGFDCTTVSAPVDWSNPDSDRIQLAVIRQESTNTTKGSLLTNPGGPGASGFDFVAYGYAVTPAAKADYDVIGWDPRGVGRSTRVTCFTDGRQNDELFYDGTDDGSSQWLAELAVKEKSYADACGTNTGELLAHMDTASNARDMDLIRAVLDSDKLNYVGYSYGSFLGTVYAQLFPQNVGAMVLDGPYDPTLVGFELFKGQMVGYDLAFRSYLEACLQGDGCPFTGTLEEAATQAQELIAGTDDSALVADDGRVLDSATVGVAIAFELFAPSYWDALSTLLSAVQAGDPEPAFDAADSGWGRYADGNYGNGIDVYTAVSCADGGLVGDSISVQDHLADIAAAAPIVGAFYARADYARVAQACAQWPVPPATLPTSWSADGAPTILIVGSTRDPATPYVWAQALLTQLASASLITRDGDGHTGYNKSNTCVDSAVDAFLLEGVVPASDPNC